MDALREQLEILANRILADEEFELVDISVKGTRSKPIFQFFVFREGGITVEDCARLSRKLSDRLDIEKFQISDYRLEVSSPGTDRPLKAEKDFRRNLGRNVDVRFTSGDQKTHQIEGTLLMVEKEVITVQSPNKTVHIPVSSIQNAKIKLKW